MAPTKDVLENGSSLLCAVGGTALQVLAEVSKDVGPTVAAGSAAGAWLGPLGIVAGALGGFGVSRVSSWLDKRKGSRDALKDFLTNHDIALAQARCVEQRLLEFVKECRKDPNHAAYVDMIEALAKDATTWWLAQVNDPARKDLDQLRDQQTAEQLTRYLANGDEVILNPAIWRSLIGKASAQMKRDPRLEGEILDHIAAYVSRHFKHDWVEALKLDFKTDGKAYAAVSLHFFAETLAAVRENGAQTAEVKQLLDVMPSLVLQLQQTAEQLGKQDLSQELRKALNASLPTIKGLLEEQTKVIKTHTTAVVEKSTAVLSGQLQEIREHLTGAQALTTDRIAAHLKEGAERLLSARTVSTMTSFTGNELAAALAAEQVAHQRRLQRIDEVMLSIAELQASEEGSPIMLEMLRLLAEENIDSALAFVDSKRSALLSATDGVIDKIRQQLQPLLKAAELLETQGRFAEAYDRYRELLKRLYDWPEAEYGLFRLLIGWCADLELHGTTAQRGPLLNEANAVAKQRCLNDPDNAQAQRDLSISYTKLGDLLNQEGKGAEARKAYEEGLTISRKLAEADKDNAQAQRDLSISYNNLGDLLKQEGKGAEARKAYEDGLSLSRKLAEADKDNAQAQRDLSYSYFQLSKTLAQLGDKLEALRLAEASLEVDERLLAIDPNNIVWQQDVQASRSWLDRLRSEG